MTKSVKALKEEIWWMDSQMDDCKTQCLRHVLLA